MENPQSTFNAFNSRFSAEYLSFPSNPLLWFSGKDLLAAMASWLQTQNIQSPKIFVQTIRDWITDGHAEKALDIFPEWRELVKAIENF